MSTGYMMQINVEDYGVSNEQTYGVAELDGHDETGEPLRDTVCANGKCKDGK